MLHCVGFIFDRARELQKQQSDFRSDTEPFGSGARWGREKKKRRERMEGRTAAEDMRKIEWRKPEQEAVVGSES